MTDGSGTRIPHHAGRSHHLDPICQQGLIRFSSMHAVARGPEARGPAGSTVSEPGWTSVARPGWRYPFAMRILVLGVGFGGLELATRLSEALGDELDLVLIDQSDSFIFGFSKLDVMFGRTPCGSGSLLSRHRETRRAIRTIDHPIYRPGSEASRDRLGCLRGRHHRRGPWCGSRSRSYSGLVEAGHEFYTVPGAFALREILSSFPGGHVIVGVTSTPFKCPPAPSETALLLHDYLTQRGIRDDSEVSLVMPLGVPIPPSPAASERCWPPLPSGASTGTPSGW